MALTTGRGPAGGRDARAASAASRIAPAASRSGAQNAPPEPVGRLAKGLPRPQAPVAGGERAAPSRPRGASRSKEGCPRGLPRPVESNATMAVSFDTGAERPRPGDHGPEGRVRALLRRRACGARPCRDAGPRGNPAPARERRDGEGRGTLPPPDAPEPLQLVHRAVGQADAGPGGGKDGPDPAPRPLATAAASNSAPGAAAAGKGAAKKTPSSAVPDVAALLAAAESAVGVGASAAAPAPSPRRRGPVLRKTEEAGRLHASLPEVRRGPPGPGRGRVAIEVREVRGIGEAAGRRDPQEDRLVAARLRDPDDGRPGPPRRPSRAPGSKG